MERFTLESKIGRGAQHVVGRLRDGILIKYPHWKGRRWDASTHETVSSDLAVHKRIGTPIPETSVVGDAEIDDGKSLIKAPYAIITEEIRGRVFRESDLEDESIREQVAALTDRSLVLKKESGTGIDFLGGAALKGFLEYLAFEEQAGRLGAYNIIIDDREKIKLIDTNLLDPRRAPSGMEWLIKGLIDLQNGLMANVLDDETLRRRYLEENPSGLVKKIVERMYALSRKIESRREQKPLLAGVSVKA
jgi:hypothetical protein